MPGGEARRSGAPFYLTKFTKAFAVTLEAP